ncbi:Smr/MutS family protein [Chryseobacterium koreense]|uniref:DNA mismatch repair protein n=1 Tax=Chryseobacterium koreense CCUG 49689 TaxID=1304281 RepID=A0A0J7IY81_9FLAO|nr:Smr/MutS family protein [Chryseobacterium koreense]KMQ70759.1 DNA mismatch repair protein [Chryseobacterium koreense CCUG 49689]MBB5333654.1 DNA-nicking Smr family endonuclease [Chryseobacterium koreense]
MKIGDTVSVVDEDLKGTITSVHGETVVFRDEYGFTHHYKKNELVLQNPTIYEGLNTIQKSESHKATSKKHQKKHLVLDLHFENLVENPQDYTSTERLFIQKEKLIETFEFCRKHRLKELEIVHGIGDGVVQNMVHDFLIGQTKIDFEQDEFFYHSVGNVMVRFR